MSIRKIKILSTLGVSGTIESNVTTLGELRPLLSAREINISGMKLMIGETRNEISLDDAKLPEGDFKLYLMPAKTKSGSRVVTICEQLAELFEELGEELSSRSEATNIAKEAISAEDAADLAELRALAGGSSIAPIEEVKGSWLD